MDLDLRLHPDDAARLPKLACVAPLVQGRPRQQKRVLVWHDDAQRSLAASGLALVEERQGWSLERLIPGEGAWPPGTPAPVLERGADPAAFDHKLPAPLAPVVSFLGRATTYTLADGVALGLLRGSFRAVTDERPVCRVLLSGPDAVVLGLAVAIARELRLEAPPACLAAEAFAVAHAAMPPARRHGAPELPAGASLPEAFAFVTGHLADVILHFAVLARDPRAGPEPVHQIRVAVRRLRSCFAVFRSVLRCPAFDQAEAGLKELNRRLAPVRDWDVFMTETAPAVLAAIPDNSKLTRLLRAADRRRHEHRAELCAWLEGPELRCLGIELAWLAASRSWIGELDEVAQQALQTELAAFAAGTLHRRMRKLLSSAEEIETLGPAALHGVRLRAKRLRYAAEIFAPLYHGKTVRRFLERLARLQQRLGEANDASVASGLLAELGGQGGRHGYAVGLVEGFAAGTAAQSREHVMESWDKFRRQGGFWE